MSLSSIYTELHRNAARTGQDRAQELRGGARLAVRVPAGVVILTISRKGKRIGDVEMVTFRRDCCVPDTAERIPAEGQREHDRDGEHWHSVSYRWKEVW